jgi:hypothetical protein
MLDHMNGSNTRELFGCACIYCRNASMGYRRADHAGIEHARQVYIGGIFSLAHGLCRAVVAHGGLADVLQFRVGGKRWRLILRDGAFLALQTICRDSEDETVSPRGDRRGCSH